MILSTFFFLSVIIDTAMSHGFLYDPPSRNKFYGIIFLKFQK
jgi:hypothetical protein